jgi:hypothetical protein
MGWLRARRERRRAVAEGADRLMLWNARLLAEITSERIPDSRARDLVAAACPGAAIAAAGILVPPSLLELPDDAGSGAAAEEELVRRAHAAVTLVTARAVSGGEDADALAGACLAGLDRGTPLDAEARDLWHGTIRHGAMPEDDGPLSDLLERTWFHEAAGWIIRPLRPTDPELPSGVGVFQASMSVLQGIEEAVARAGPAAD